MPATFRPLARSYPIRPRRHAHRGRALGAALAVVALGLFALRCAGARSVPAAAPVELAAQAVAFESGSGSTIRGWLARGRPGGGAVLLLHGIGASRVEMLGRARFLHAAGYSVLLIDFRGHGESTSAEPTYGALERLDARAALAFLQAAVPGERVGVIGISMGGAAALLAGPLPVQALVLESVYPTIHDAIRDRLRTWVGPLGPALTGLAEGWLFPRQGVTEGDLRPIDRIGAQTAPVFVLAGTADRYTPPEESRALFERAPEPKQLWEVKDAAHEDLHAFAGLEYERRVGAFLARWLRPAPGALAGPGR